MSNQNNKVLVSCINCDGTGQWYDVITSTFQTCERCGGTGFVNETDIWTTNNESTK